MTTKTLPKIPPPKAARKGVAWPRRGAGPSPSSDPQAELQAYLATLDPGEREAEEGGLQAFLQGEQVAPEWYSASGSFTDANVGGPSTIYRLAQRLKGVPTNAKGGPLTLREPSMIVGQRTGKVFGTIDENGARDPETVAGPALTIVNPGKKQAPPMKRTRKGAPAFAYGSVAAGPGGTVTPNPAFAQQGTGMDPGVKLARQNDINANRTYLEEQKRANLARTGEEFNLQQAGRNTEDLAATAQAKSLRSAEGYKYGAFGLDQPEEINVQPGQTMPGNVPGVRASLRTQQETMADSYGQNNRLRGLGLEAARFKTGESGLNVQQAQLDAADRESQSAGGPQSSGPARATDYQSMHPTVARSGVFRSAGPTPNGNAAAGYSAADVAAISHHVGAPGSSSYLAEAQKKFNNTPQVDPETGQLAYQGDINSRYGGPNGLAIAKANQAIVEDPETGRPTTRAELLSRMGPAEQNLARSRQGVVEDPLSGQPTTRAELAARTDRAGNVKGPDGVWTDPKSGNKLIDGKWVDPRTGNFQVDANTWSTADGQAHYVITNPKTGSGYWRGAPGTAMSNYVLGSNGIWENPLYGSKIINGVDVSAATLAANRKGKEQEQTYAYGE